MAIDKPHDVETAPEEIDPQAELQAVMGEVSEDFDPSNIEIENFVIDGQVDMETAERYKDVIPASDLEVLNQLKPGIIFDLFVDITGDGQFQINFGGNQDADAHIGLSQIMRGYSQKYEGGARRLEAVREIYINEGEEVHTATRVGLAGNFYEGTESTGSYQEVHSGYVIEITQENEQAAAQVEAVTAEAEEAITRLARKPSIMEGTRGEESITVARFRWDEGDQEYKIRKKPRKKDLLKYVYIEARLQDVDPNLAIAIVDAASLDDTRHFENDFQWTLRAIKESEIYYKATSAVGPKDDNGRYTPEFIAYLISSGQELFAGLNTREFEKTYGKLIGEKFELPAPSSNVPLHPESVRNLEDPQRHELMTDIVSYEGVRLSSDYGKRTDPVTGKLNADHRGIDIAAPTGAPIRASEEGTVINAEFQGGANGGGWFVRIQHPSGYITQYLHADKILDGIVPGATVTKGQEIAKVGSTGKSTGAHLHFEVFSLKNPSKGASRRSNRNYVNPWDYLDQANQAVA